MPTPDTAALLQTLQTRFSRHPHRHPDLRWPEVQARLLGSPASLASLLAMEATGGEPDAVCLGHGPTGFAFCDCSPESPAGRRSLCFDGRGREARKENRPRSSALEEAAAMGCSLLTEQQYHDLQALGEFDTRTSSWIDTPAELRARGGALFGDRRYGRVFVYHNGADAYFAARGFRALRVVG